MDKPNVRTRLEEGARRLEIELSPAMIQDFLRLSEELLRWNSKVNLTAVTDPDLVVERHFLDSLGALPLVHGAKVLDVGSGGGFPGLAWALARPSMDVTMVDAVAKKVGFIKHAAVSLGIAARARGLHLRLEGRPEREGLSQFDTVVSRALMDVEPWLKLARPYVAATGEVLAMVAHPPAETVLQDHARAAGLRFAELRRYELPGSGDPRAVLRFVPS